MTLDFSGSKLTLWLFEVARKRLYRFPLHGRLSWTWKPEGDEGIGLKQSESYEWRQRFVLSVFGTLFWVARLHVVTVGTKMQKQAYLEKHVGKECVLIEHIFTQCLPLFSVQSPYIYIISSIWPSYIYIIFNICSHYIYFIVSIYSPSYLPDI